MTTDELRLFEAAMSEAILREREEIAQIADDIAHCAKLPEEVFNSYTFGQAYRLALEHIAASIRARSKASRAGVLPVSADS